MIGLGSLTRLLSASLLAIGISAAAPLAHADFTEDERLEIGEIVKDYLLDNPEVLRDAFIELQRRETAALQEQQRDALREYRDRIENAPGMPVVGNPEGDVTLVEFFDYNCPYCSHALADLRDLLNADPNVRVVLFEMPILGEGSLETARVSLAAARQGNYLELHSALLGARGQKNEARALQIAEALGFDMERLRRDMEDPEIMAIIQNAVALAQEIGINGTPSYVVGDQILGGMQSFAALRSAVEEVREAACETC